MKPVPINGPLARFTPSATSVPVVDQPLSSASSPALPAAVSSSSSSFAAAYAPQRRALGRKGRAAAAAAVTSRDDAARVRELEDELDRVRTMNTLLSERMDKGISVLGKLLSEATTESPPDMVRVKIALAAIKQVRDILSGELDFDENILHANETALVMAEVRVFGGFADCTKQCIAVFHVLCVYMPRLRAVSLCAILTGLCLLALSLAFIISAHIYSEVCVHVL